MIIGSIKEIKDNENRVGLLPDGVSDLVSSGHTVIIESLAGEGSGYSDADYKKAGAKIALSAKEVVSAVDVLVKVKEPVPQEYSLLQLMEGKTLFTYLHLSAVDKILTELLLENDITAIAYETVEDKSGRLPLLKPMSEVAGVLAVQYGAQYLQKKYGGRGVSLGVIEGTDKANVVVIGGGVVGASSAMTAAGLGCNVTVIERGGTRFDELPRVFKNRLKSLSKNISIVRSMPASVTKAVKNADLVIGSILVKGAKAPRIVTESMVRSMKTGCVIVDVAIDQGGCIWGSRPTSHSDPIYELHDKVFCCITNMPGQVSNQSSQALCSATFPYLKKLADLGVQEAIKSDKGLAKGVNTFKGAITYSAVAEGLHLKKYFKELRL